MSWTTATPSFTANVSGQGRRSPGPSRGRLGVKVSAKPRAGGQQLGCQDTSSTVGGRGRIEDLALEIGQVGERQEDVPVAEHEVGELERACPCHRGTAGRGARGPGGHHDRGRPPRPAWAPTTWRRGSGRPAPLSRGSPCSFVLRLVGEPEAGEVQHADPSMVLAELACTTSYQSMLLVGKPCTSISNGRISTSPNSGVEDPAAVACPVTRRGPLEERPARASHSASPIAVHRYDILLTHSSRSRRTRAVGLIGPGPRCASPSVTSLAAPQCHLPGERLGDRVRPLASSCLCSVCLPWTYQLAVARRRGRGEPPPA